MIDTYFKQYFWTFYLLAIAGSAFLIARTVNAYVGGALAPAAEAIANTPREVSPANRVEESKAPLAAILERNVFHAKREDMAAEIAAKEQERLTGKAGGSGVAGRNVVFDENNCVRSQMATNLLATVVANDAENSIAVFGDPAKKDQVEHTAYRVGDKVLDQAEVMAVDWRRVTVKHDGRCEFFSLEEDDPTKPAVAANPTPVAPTGDEVPPAEDLAKNVKKLSGNQYEIPKGDIDNVLSNMNSLATQARIVPNFTNGKADGFKLFSIRPGSLYAKIGIENGDVISRINGYEMNSPDKALEIYSKLKDAQSITVDLVRGGKTQTLSYQIR
jgi:general secretion pathway protein C